MALTLKGQFTVVCDRLYDLFAELRRLKTVELPGAEKKLYPVQRALRLRSVHGDIQRIEKEIEREMKDENA